jgi:hypothetical protein
VFIDGLGNYSRAISTKSELAQKFFDQGLGLVYDYYSPEATASFKEALRHDPDHPMPHWALALALGPIPNSRFLVFSDDPLPGNREAVRTLNRMLALNPNHPGAVHLYIHLFDSSAHPECALPQADRLESVMPRT